MTCPDGIAAWVPKPIDVSGIELPEDLEDLREMLAENAHNVWALLRLSDGWRWGAERDDMLRTHPDLVSYANLPEEEKRYDREMATTTLKVIQRFGFRICRLDDGGAG